MQKLDEGHADTESTEQRDIGCLKWWKNWDNGWLGGGGRGWDDRAERPTKVNQKNRLG